ncbi:MAG: DUF3291 domain-containing protein [Chitinophagales bacterium]
MKATITLIELKSPFHFFSLSYKALKIMQQMKSSNHLEYKNTGFWTKHYTMTLWKSEEDLKAFAMSGAHLKAMKESKSIAKEIKTLTIDANELPNWKTAKKMLENVKGISY